MKMTKAQVTLCTDSLVTITERFRLCITSGPCHTLGADLSSFLFFYPLSLLFSLTSPDLPGDRVLDLQSVMDLRCETMNKCLYLESKTALRGCHDMYLFQM